MTGTQDLMFVDVWKHGIIEPNSKQKHFHNILLHAKHEGTKLEDFSALCIWYNVNDKIIVEHEKHSPDSGCQR